MVYRTLLLHCLSVNVSVRTALPFDDLHFFQEVFMLEIGFSLEGGTLLRLGLGLFQVKYGHFLYSQFINMSYQ